MKMYVYINEKHLLQRIQFTFSILFSLWKVNWCHKPNGNSRTIWKKLHMHRCPTTNKLIWEFIYLLHNWCTLQLSLWELSSSYSLWITFLSLIHVLSMWLSLHFVHIGCQSIFLQQKFTVQCLRMSIFLCVQHFVSP